MKRLSSIAEFQIFGLMAQRFLAEIVAEIDREFLHHPSILRGEA